jgi:uncharacterized protein YozE (UPF0346 family)
MLWAEVFVLKIMGYNKRNMEQNKTPLIVKMFNNNTFPKQLMNYELLKEQVNEILFFLSFKPRLWVFMD